MNEDVPSTVYWIEDRLYLNITNLCSNKCWFCFRNFKPGIGEFNLKLKKEPTVTEIVAALEAALSRRRWREVIFCGFGEPTTRLDVLIEVLRWVKSHFPPIPIRLDTNGHGFALNKGRDVVLELKNAGVDKVSVSLNGYDEETYSENCRPDLSNAFALVVEFVNKAKLEFDVEVTAVRMPEVDIQKVRDVADKLGVPFRVRDYVPCFW